MKLKSLAASIMCCMAATALAQDLVIDGIAYNFLNNHSEVEVTSPNNFDYSGEIIIPESVEVPGWGASFSVTAIGEYAFQDCTALTSVRIPISITKIHKGAFVRCFGLQHVYCLNETPTKCETDIFFWVHTDTCVLHVPAGCVEAYQAADGWKDFVNIVGDQAGIEDVTTADGPAEYFDLQGRKVTDPSNGIFIKKQGNSTKKVLL